MLTKKQFKNRKNLVYLIYNARFSFVFCV